MCLEYECKIIPNMSQNLVFEKRKFLQKDGLNHAMCVPVPVLESTDWHARGHGKDSEHGINFSWQGEADADDVHLIGNMLLLHPKMNFTRQHS